MNPLPLLPPGHRLLLPANAQEYINHLRSYTRQRALDQYRNDLLEDQRAFMAHPPPSNRRHREADEQLVQQAFARDMGLFHQPGQLPIDPATVGDTTLIRQTLNQQDNLDPRGNLSEELLALGISPTSIVDFVPPAHNPFLTPAQNQANIDREHQTLSQRQSQAQAMGGYTTQDEIADMIIELQQIIPMFFVQPVSPSSVRKIAERMLRNGTRLDDIRFELDNSELRDIIADTHRELRTERQVGEDHRQRTINQQAIDALPQQAARLDLEARAHSRTQSRNPAKRQRR